MKKAIVFTVFVSLLVMTSCYFGIPCIEGYGDYYDETREITGFYNVSNTTSFDVYVTQADTFSVIVSAQENILPLIETNRTGNSLIIKTREGSCIRNTSGVEVYVSLPEIEELRLTGSGLLLCERVDGNLVELSITSSGRLIVDTVFCNELQIRHTASGKFESSLLDNRHAEMDLTGSGRLEFGELNTETCIVGHSSSGSVRGAIFGANESDLSITGSGSIVVQGDSEAVYTKHTSSGRIDALDLFAVDVNCRATGSGNTYVNVSGILDVSISGSGDIIYTGNPSETLITDTGSGELRMY